MAKCDTYITCNLIDRTHFNPLFYQMTFRVILAFHTTLKSLGHEMNFKLAKQKALKG